MTYVFDLSSTAFHAIVVRHVASSDSVAQQRFPPDGRCRNAGHMTKSAISRCVRSKASQRV